MGKCTSEIEITCKDLVIVIPFKSAASGKSFSECKRMTALFQVIFFDNVNLRYGLEIAFWKK